MGKTQIDEDKSTPSGELLDWINRWIHRGVNRSEIIGLLTLCVRYLEAEAIKAMMEPKKPIDDADTTPYNELREAVLGLRNEVDCRIERGAASGGHLLYMQEKLSEMLKEQEPQP